MCNCKKGKGSAAAKTGTFKVKLPGGLEVVKSTEAAATAYAAKHPGSLVIKS